MRCSCSCSSSSKQTALWPAHEDTADVRRKEKMIQKQQKKMKMKTSLKMGYLKQHWTLKITEDTDRWKRGRKWESALESFLFKGGPPPFYWLMKKAVQMKAIDHSTHMEMMLLLMMMMHWLTSTKTALFNTAVNNIVIFVPGNISVFQTSPRLHWARLSACKHTTTITTTTTDFTYWF